MNLKKIIIAGAISLSPGASSTHTATTRENIVKQKKTEIFEEIKKTNKEKPTKYIIGSKDLSKLDSLDLVSNSIITRSTSELLKTPLAMHGTQKHLGEYLGYTQYESIMEKYNTKYQSGEKMINQIDEVSFPLIYDDINTSIPHDLSTYLEDPKFDIYREKVKGEENLIVVAKDDNEKYILLFFKNKKLFLGSSASIGKGTSTPKGVFEIQNKISKKRSSKYKNAPMPYALYITKHIFSHQGKVTGEKISHGCIRMPGCYQEILFFSVKEKTKILLAE